MTVLITGGAGFVGRRLADRLSESGCGLLALDSLAPQVHLDPSTSAAGFPGELVVGDVAEESSWTSLTRPDAVVHLAAETGTGQSMYEHAHYRRVNVGGTSLAVRHAVRWGVPLVFVSSRAVYGEGRHACPRHGESFTGACCERAAPQPSREEDPHRPVSVYGRTKSEGEATATTAARTVPVTVVRPQNVVGPGQALHNPYTGVLAAFLAQLREGRPLTVYGDGRQTRDLMHVDDLVTLLVWILEHPPEVGRPRVLNAGTGVRTTLLELARSTADAAPLDREDVEITRLDVHRAGDITHACADLDRVRALGAPAPRWSTRAAVRDFVRASWSQPGAAASAWDDALHELASRGLDP